MGCKIRYLSSGGIQQREVKGVQALADAFPINWLMYVSLSAFPKNSSPIEIDVMVVMDDRIVLLELKDWNGLLTANGDNWLVNGAYRGRSPVILGAEKARKIKGIIANAIPKLASSYVDSRVVLTATSTGEHLNDAEREQVLSLEEACSLAKPQRRRDLLGDVKLTPFKPSTFVKEFEKLLGESRYFEPLKMSWDGYVVTDEDFYVHGKGVWREHRAELVREDRVKALLRLWRFDQLPVGLNEPAARRLVAERDMRVQALLGERGSWMGERGILKLAGTPPEEVLTQHPQLLSLPTNWTTLRRYLERNTDMTGEQRIDIVHCLVSMGAELHGNDIAHRDIGSDCVWLGTPTSMSLTGFASSRLPDDQSVSDWLMPLATYAEPEPDWGGDVATAKERDVRSLGVIMKEIGDGAVNGDLPDGWEEVAERALAKPGTRYADATVLADAIGELRTPSGPLVDQSRLDAYESEIIPYVAWPPTTAPSAKGRSSRYETIDAHGITCVVKVWNGVARGDAERDLALLAMFDAAAALHAVGMPAIAPVRSFGLSLVGPFVVTEHVPGVDLGALSALDLAETVSILDHLAEAVTALHARQLTHGDLHPGNVIVQERSRIVLIDVFDISQTGIGRLHSARWAPADHERRSAEQVDRFAVCRIAADLLAPHASDEAVMVLSALDAELSRNSIETLEPVIEALRVSRRRIEGPKSGTFHLTASNLRALQIDGDDGRLWVRSYVNGTGETFFLTGVRHRLVITMRGGEVETCEVSEALLRDLGQGASVPLLITTAPGLESGIAELANHLRQVAPPETVADRTPGAAVMDPEADMAEGGSEIADFGEGGADDGDTTEEPTAVPTFERKLDIARLWLRSAELEEDCVPRVRLDGRVGESGGSAIYRYESGQPLEFEDDDIVEVRLDAGRGRKIGVLDVPKCDSRDLAIRDLRSFIADGQTVTLIDKRDRISKERRRRAVERITSRQGVVPNLVDFFDPRIDAPQIDFDLDVTEADLQCYGLNAGQREAFRRIIKTGPMGLLQGPPGSGKTLFIASLTHWLLTKGGARRVLIASQSHEAVNNVLEGLLKTFRKQGGQADILRVGSRGATDRIRPYQARSLRDRYRLRFENGLKTRVAAAAGAAGISRTMAHEVVDLDRRLGALERSLQLARVSAEADDASADERRRSASRLQTLERAFAASAADILGRPVDLEAEVPAALIEHGYAELMTRHPKASPGDLATLRRILALSREWTESLGTGHRNFDEFLAKTRSVVAGTCVGLGQSQIKLEQGSFDWVIVDEAARCTHGELAVPIQLGNRVVLVGDQRQLKPMVNREVEEGLVEELRGIARREIVRSDFERAFESRYGARNAVVLDEQYRMDPGICGIVSRVFYAPHGVVLNPSEDRLPDAAFEDLPADLSVPIVWYDTAKAPGAEEHSKNNRRDFWNEAEIEGVMALLERLAREVKLEGELIKRAEPSIGIICMYGEQKRQIEKAWSQRHFSDGFRRAVTIDTVDAYQGKENAIVILTLVRANGEYGAGHVRSPNRCNVAISRAKERLYIFGHTRMWEDRRCHSPMRDVLSEIRGLAPSVANVVPVKDIR